MVATLTLAQFAWKNIWRRQLRTSLTLCGIAMGIGAFVALVGFSRSFEQEWMKLYESTGTDLAVVQRTFMNTTVDEQAAATIRALPIGRRCFSDDLQHDGHHPGGQRSGLWPPGEFV